MKVDITYLKRLISELEKLSEEAEKLKSEEINISQHEYLIALNKAAGICLGVTTEAGALVGDIQKLIVQAFKPKEDNYNSLLDTYLKPIKVGQN